MFRFRVLQKDRIIMDVISHLLEDMNRRKMFWGESGKIHHHDFEERGRRRDNIKVPFPFLERAAVGLNFFTVCAGLRFLRTAKTAKLEIKLAIALFLSKFDYDIVDASGKSLKCLPQPDRNNIYKMRNPWESRVISSSNEKCDQRSADFLDP
ncbi:hypothetical protein B0H13DRAFT_2454686 [Mycena leptocephala]|nr:hypothetical protein B0H13DRAFT_2454686 [Mycena leptocephala]